MMDSLYQVHFKIHFIFPSHYPISLELILVYLILSLMNWMKWFILQIRCTWYNNIFHIKKPTDDSISFHLFPPLSCPHSDVNKSSYKVHTLLVLVHETENIKCNWYTFHGWQTFEFHLFLQLRSTTFVVGICFRSIHLSPSLILFSFSISSSSSPFLIQLLFPTHTEKLSFKPVHTLNLNFSCQVNI